MLDGTVNEQFHCRLLQLLIIPAGNLVQEWATIFGTIDWGQGEKLNATRMYPLHFFVCTLLYLTCYV